MIIRPRLNVAALAALCLSGCGETPDRSLIRSGHYQLHGYAHDNTKLGMKLDVDRTARTATFSFPDGSSRTLGFSLKPEEQWETGCWAEDSDYHTEMEVAALNAGTLALEATTPHALSSGHHHSKMAAAIAGHLLGRIHGGCQLREIMNMLLPRREFPRIRNIRR